jgi:hypothetical protein
MSSGLSSLAITIDDDCWGAYRIESLVQLLEAVLDVDLRVAQPYFRCRLDCSPKPDPEHQHFDTLLLCLDEALLCSGLIRGESIGDHQVNLRHSCSAV